MNQYLYLHNVATLTLDQEKCIGCAMCATVCPHGVFHLHNKKAHIRERDACMECGACVTNCPVEAIEVDSGAGCAQLILNAALGRKTAGC